MRALPCHCPYRGKPAFSRAAVSHLVPQIPIDELAESLAEGLSVGHPDMPEFVFEPDDITAILAYLNSIQKQ
jgi:hypothetical protein